VGVLDCVKSSGCAATTIEECYCGAGVDPIACLTGGARGACKAQIEAAAEETDPVKISERFVDPGFALGNANRLLQCDKEFCTPCPIIAASDAGAEVPVDAVAGTADAAIDAPPDVSVSMGGAGGEGGMGGMDAGAGGAGGTDASIDAATSMEAGAEVAGNGGAGVEAGGDIPIGECADLDRNDVLDCRETLLASSDFDNGIQGWVGEAFMNQAWDMRDAQGNSHSGSLLVTNTAQADADGATMRGARQCIAATPGATYRLFLQLFVPSGQGAGSAGAAIHYHASPDCSGAVTQIYTSPLVGGPDTWHTVTGNSAAPAEARSLSVRLVAIKPLRQPALKVFFDNILVKAP
jgi:hypothetical protein